MNKQLLFFLILLIGLATQSFAFGTFKIDPLTPAMQDQLTQNNIWKSDCPIQLNDLTVITFSYYDFSGNTHDDGQIILSKKSSQGALQALQGLYEKEFPIRSASTLINFKGNWQDAENQNMTYGFNCFRDDHGKFSQESYGNTITINPIENPEINFITNSPYAGLCNVLNRFMDCEKLFPSAKVTVQPAQGILSINRSLQLKGMVETIVPVFESNGFFWQGDSVEHINWKKFVFTKGDSNALPKNN